MSDSSISLSRKLDRSTVELYRAVDQAIRQADARYLVVGASARDLLHHHGYGMNVLRATADADFGIQVANWEQFELVRQNLIDAGFETTRLPHRLLSPIGLNIDIVPFGDIADELFSIAWPPEHGVAINVLGFDDALKACIHVRLSDSPDLNVPIASAAGISLLKVIAWTDREREMRIKDAKDLLYLAMTFERFPDVDVHGDLDILERFGFDVTQVGAYMLGKCTVDISAEASRNYVRRFLCDELKNRHFDELIDESLESAFSPRTANELVLTAFKFGYLEAG